MRTRERSFRGSRLRIRIGPEINSARREGDAPAEAYTKVRREPRCPGIGKLFQVDFSDRSILVRALKESKDFGAIGFVDERDDDVPRLEVILSGGNPHKPIPVDRSDEAPPSKRQFGERTRGNFASLADL